MPAFEVMDLRQDAVLWSFAGNDRRGQPTYYFPVAVKVRWLNKLREVLQPDGTTIAIEIQVIIARDVKIGSVFWLGKLEDLPDSFSSPDSGLYQAITFDSTPDIKNRNVRRTLNLMRYKDTLTVVPPRVSAAVAYAPQKIRVEFDRPLVAGSINGSSTGWSVKVNGVTRALTGAKTVLNSDPTVLGFTIGSGVMDSDDLITISYSGGTGDLLGLSDNQAVLAFSNYDVINDV